MTPPKRRARGDYRFGQRLLTLRERASLTQARLAQQLGVSARAVLNWEGGVSYPDPAHLRALITVSLQHGAFPAGEEFSAAAELWELAATHARTRTPDLDRAWLAALVQTTRTASPTWSAPALPTSNWDGAPAPSALYGRAAEVATLVRWVADDGCRVVALLGIGGIGKTALAATLSQRLTPTFDVVFWRSLGNAPPLEHLLDECLQAKVRACFQERLSSTQRFWQAGQTTSDATTRLADWSRYQTSRQAASGEREQMCGTRHTRSDCGCFASDEKWAGHQHGVHRTSERHVSEFALRFGTPSSGSRTHRGAAACWDVARWRAL